MDAGRPAPQISPLANLLLSAPLSEPCSLSIKDPILLGIWPSGAGKTSLSLSVKACPLQRISLGGIRDEAQICTYVASSRRFIIQVFHIASCIDLVILLDEVDKLAQVICMEIYRLRSGKSWISDRTGASIMIMSMFQLIYLKIDLSTLPIFSTLYLRRYSMDVK